MKALNVDKIVQDYCEQSNIHEFPFFCIGRQGGRTAVEILARALIMKGKYVYLGQNLGRRSMATNTMVVRFADKPNMPSGISVMYPSGMMFMHEELMWPDYGSLDYTQVRRAHFVSKFTSGILMVCTSKEPTEVEYPIDFQGTVATVDAERIFTEKISIQPAPSGITALGLFAAATADIIDIETLIEATLNHERLSKRVRELNVECMKEAYEKTNIVHNMNIKGKVSLEEYKDMADRKPSSDLITKEERNVGTLWREHLPLCDVRKCVCIECLAAYFCPEGAIRWEDEAYHVDYDACKGCGTCALECPENAIVMEEATKVLADKAKQGGR